MQCTGYEKTIVFDFARDGEGRATRLRRQLFTDGERESMCLALTSSVLPETEHELLCRIEEECERPSADVVDFSTRYGPFGAFRSNQAASSPYLDDLIEFPHQSGYSGSTFTAEPIPDFQYRTCLHDVLNPDGDSLDSSDTGLSPARQDLIRSIYEQDMPVTSLLSPTFWDTTEAEELERSCEPFVTMPEYETYMAVSEVPAMHNLDLCRRRSPVPASLAFNNEDVLTTSAPFLLKHYTAEVIKSLTPVRQAKTPWHTLFVPHLKHCLAGVTLDEQLNNAELVYFHGTLAISAFSLGGASNSRAWTELGGAHLLKAHRSFEAMLETAYSVPKPTKYKTILMALLAMMYVSLFAGTQQSAERYFLETERFIRIKGLNRRKSRKVRLLHHCYAFERFFHESVCVRELDSPQRSLVHQAIFASGSLGHSFDSLDFSLPKWTDLDREMQRPKSREMSENDLHLEHPGVWTNSMYPEIFGVSEEWIFCLSMVIRLGREKKNAEEQQERQPSGAGDPITLKSLCARAKALEKSINRMRLRPQTDARNNIPPQLADTINGLIQTSLSIFFYRRIFDLDPDILQQKVLQVRDCLVRCCEDDDSGTTTIHNSAVFVWSAFIAACEAQDQLVREFFSTWFRNAARQTGLHFFLRSLSQIEKVWLDGDPG